MLNRKTRLFSVIDENKLQQSINVYDIKEILIQITKGRDVDTLGSNNETALTRAASNGDADAVISLLDMGASWSHVNKFGRNALIKASSGGKANIIQVLLDRRGNGDLFHKDECGKTALDWARVARCEESCKLLEEAIATELDSRRKKKLDAERIATAMVVIDQSNKEADAMLDAVTRNDLLGIKACAESMTINRATLQSALDIVNENVQQENDKRHDTFSLDVSSKGGWRAVVRAAVGNDENLIALLASKEADINCETSQGHTALTWASTLGHEGVVRELIKLGALIVPTKSEGKTAITHACYNGKGEILDMLLEAVTKRSFEARRQQIETALQLRTEVEGASALAADWVDFYEHVIYSKDKFGKQAMDYAKRQNHIHCIELMEIGIQRAVARRDLLAAEAADAKPTLCSVSCGSYIRADELSRHETHLCPKRLVPCMKDCGVVHTIEETEAHLRDSCDRRILRCENVYFGCNKQVMAKDLEVHEKSQCQKRIVPCRLECGEEMRYDERCAHEYDACPLRVCDCKLDCGSRILAQDMSEHTSNLCVRRLIKCPIKCGLKLEFQNIDSHIANECMRPCKWKHMGCKEIVGPIVDRETHEKYLCQYMPTECLLSCGIQGLYEGYRLKHQNEECPRRLQACPNSCGRNIEVQLMNSHVDAERGDCPTRLVHCRRDIIGKRIKVTYDIDIFCKLFQKEMPNLLADVDKSLPLEEQYVILQALEYRARDEKIKWACGSGKSIQWHKMCEVGKYEELDQSGWACGNLKFKDRVDHEKHECTLNIVKCTCSQAFPIKDLQKHKDSFCPHRKIICRFGCGETIFAQDMLNHEESDCSKRLISCRDCSEKVICDSMENHLKSFCVRRPIRCMLGCGNHIPLEDITKHENEQCIKRLVDCPRNCKHPNMWAEHIDRHLKETCIFREVNCPVGCNKRMKFCDKEDHVQKCEFAKVPCPYECNMLIEKRLLENHQHYDCLMKPLPCTQGCGMIVPEKEKEHHETTSCKKRFVECKLGCDRDVRWDNQEYHRQNQCVKRPSKCKFDCLDTLRFEELELHHKLCIYQPIPCGSGSRGCGRQLRSWIYGDVHNGEGSLVICEPHRDTGFASLAASGNAEGCQSMLNFMNKRDIDHESTSGHTALTRASANGHHRVVKLLIENGADKNKETEGGRTALLEAIYGNHASVIDVLIGFDVDILYKTRFGVTAIRWANQWNRTDLLEMLNDAHKLQTDLRKLWLAISVYDYEAVKEIVGSGVPHVPDHARVLAREKDDFTKRLNHVKTNCQELQEMIDTLVPNMEKQEQQVIVREKQAEFVLQESHRIANEVKLSLEGLKPLDVALKKSLKTIQSNHVRQLLEILYPDPIIEKILKAVCILRNIPPNKITDPKGTGALIEDYWGTSRQMLKDRNFILNLEIYNFAVANDEMIKKVQEIMKDPLFDYVAGEEGYLLVEICAQWVRNKEQNYTITKNAGPQRALSVSKKAEYTRLLQKIYVDSADLRSIQKKVGLLLSNQEPYLKEKNICEEGLRKNQKQLWVARLLSFRTPTNHTALTWAAVCGNHFIVDLLCRCGSPVDYEDIHTRQAALCIQLAWRSHHWKKTRLPWNPSRSLGYRITEIQNNKMIKKAVLDLRSIRINERIPLIEALYNGNFEVAKELLRRKATSFRLSWLKPSSPFPYQLVHYSNKSIDKGSSVLYGLESAVRLGMEQLGCQSYINGRGWVDSGKHESSLQLAIKTESDCKERIENSLRVKGRNAKIKMRVTEEEEMRKQMNISILSMNFEKVVELVEAGAPIDHETPDGDTALTMAAGRATQSMNADGDKVYAVELLLDRRIKRPNIDRENARGHTALTWASHCGHTLICEILIDRGATVNTACKSGRTALIAAAANGKTDVVRLLLECGAQVNVVDKKGKTAMEYARQRSFFESVRLLSQAQYFHFGKAAASFGKADPLLACCWGCGEKGVKVDIKNHELTTCPKRDVECPLNCMEAEIWSEELEDHLANKCINRIVPCPLKCDDDKIKSCKLENHIKNECGHRQVACTLKCGKVIQANVLERHLELHCDNRLVPCDIPECEETKIPYCKLPHHRREECLKRRVRCRLGCPEEFKAEYRPFHEMKICKRREVKCKWQCEKLVILEEERIKHELEECILRPIQCINKCDDLIIEADMDSHMKYRCNMRFVPCSIKCGKNVREREMSAHQRTECTKRQVSCRLGCGRLMIEDKRDSHEGQDCEYRLITCGNGCGNKICSKDLSFHKKDECPKRIIPCPRECTKTMFADEIDNHLRWQCRLRLIYCPYGCKETIVAQKAKGHGNVCGMVLIPCNINGKGCGLSCRRQDMEIHLAQECVRRHNTKQNLNGESSRKISRAVL